MKVLIAAGGTGGHVYPGLAVAEALRQRGHTVVWLGNAESFEARAVAKADLSFRTIRMLALRGKGLLRRLAMPWHLLRAVWGALLVLRAERPAVVLGMGGYVAAPAGLAAWLWRRPLVIHEQNARAGLTNRALARLARRRLQGFDGALPGGETVGNPVRPAIAALPPPETRPLRTGPLRVLVLGGSQGARSLNERLPPLFARLAVPARPLIRHQGGLTVERARAAYAEAGVQAEVTPFIEDMAAAYAEADLVICRAGASTVAEVAAAGRPAIFIPFPHAVDDHQTANARPLVAAGAAWLLPEAELNEARFKAIWTEATPERLARMAKAARREARPDATDRIVAVLEAVGAKT